MTEKRRAIGEIMAAMILLLIASLAGILLFTSSLRTSNLQGEILRSQVEIECESSQERFRVISAHIDGDNIKTWVLNYGEIQIEIIDIYINGARTNFYQSGGKMISTESLPELITLTIPDGITGPNYRVKVVSQRGVKNVSEWCN